MDLTLTTGTSLGKKGKLGCTWWKLIDNSTSPFKGAWEQVTLTRKNEPLGVHLLHEFGFCRNTHQNLALNVSNWILRVGID